MQLKTILFRPYLRCGCWDRGKLRNKQRPMTRQGTFPARHKNKSATVLNVLSISTDFLEGGVAVLECLTKQIYSANFFHDSLEGTIHDYNYRFA